MYALGKDEILSPIVGGVRTYKQEALEGGTTDVTNCGKVGIIPGKSRRKIQRISVLY